MAVAYLGYGIDSSGAVTAASDLDKMTAAAIKAEQGSKTLGAAAQTAGKKSFFAGSGFRNMALQLNQVGQQTAASGDLLRSFTIQLPDLLLGFGTMGIAIGALAPLMVGLGTSFITGGKDVEEFSDALDGVVDSLDEYISLVEGQKGFGSEGFSAARDDLTAISQAYTDLIAIAKIEALNSITAATNSLAASVLNYSYTLGEIGDTGDLLDIETQLQGNITEWKNNREAAAKFGDALKSLQNAGTLEKQYESALRLKDMFSQAVDVNGEMSDRQLEFWKNLNQSVYQMELLGAATSEAEKDVYSAVDATDEWAGSMAGVLSYVNSIGGALASIGGSLISSASKQVQTDALRAGKSIVEARIAGQDYLASQEALAKRTAAGDNVFKRVAAEAAIAADAVDLNRTRVLASEMALAAEREKEASKAATSKRGGGKSSARAASRLAKEYGSDLESLIESLATERETVDAWYAESQVLLNDQRSMELLGQEGHAQAKLRIEEEYQQRLSEIRNGYQGSALDQTEAFMGGMAAALQGGNDKMQAAAQAFASVEALINAYRAYNQVIADPSLPWFAKIPAAAGVLAAGMKTVQSIKSLSGSGGSSSSTTSVPSATSSTETTSQQRAVIQVTGGRSRFTIDEMNDIIAGIQDASTDGVIIEGFTS